ncbi:MAG: Integrase [Nitrosopumilales archaeon]|nr:MAG: Integrase [Nitrosopumilales archaeon]
MKLTKDKFQRAKDQSALARFSQGIKADETRDKYTRSLKMILCNIFEDFLEGNFEQRANQFVELGRKDPKYVLDLLLNLSVILKERTKLSKNHENYFNPSSFDNYFKPIKKLFDMNDVSIPWKRVYITFPEISNVLEGRGWTKQEIQKMLNHANGSIDRAIVLVAASSGIRGGGFELKWQDMHPVYKVDNHLTMETKEEKNSELVCAMLKVYAGSNEQYPAFITPEAYLALMDYKIVWIQEVGREDKPTEPIFKKEGDLPRPASPTSIKKRVERMARAAKLRPPLPKGQRRYEVPIMNGFRRFWNKTCKEALSRDSPLASFIKKEYMMGHMGLFKLDKNYFKSQILELAEEYLNVVSNLTISNELKFKAENLRLKKDNDSLVEANKKILELEKNFKVVIDSLPILAAKDPKIRLKRMQEFKDNYKLKPDQSIGISLNLPNELREKVVESLN